MADLNDYGFPFNSVSSDRQYNASVWRKYFSNIFTNGVVPDKLNKLIVTESDTPAKSVKVDTGYIMIEGVQYGIETAIDLTIDDNASGNTRIDRIVARVDYTNRTAEIEVLKGTAGAGAPTLTQTTTTYELSLAQVEATNGFTTITNSNITNERDFMKIGSIENYQIASQLEAETGTVNDKYMTPLRTKQAIDEFSLKGFSVLSDGEYGSGIVSFTSVETDELLVADLANNRFVITSDLDGKLLEFGLECGLYGFKTTSGVALYKNGTQHSVLAINSSANNTNSGPRTITGSYRSTPIRVSSGDYFEIRTTSGNIEAGARFSIITV